MRFLSLLLLLLAPVLFAQTSRPNPYAARGTFSVDDEADPSSRQPELLHPRLSLSNAVATVARSSSQPKESNIEIVFYSFPFTERDIAAARRGDIAFLDKRWKATQSTNLKSPEINGGGRAVVKLTLDEHFQIREVNLSVPGYNILLDDGKLKNFDAQNFQFNGKKLTLKSKGAYRLDLKLAGVPSFTMNWDIDLSTVVFAKTPPKD
jgi:hypothetical protein